jgi:asparagine synthase (glutamine-hydrolysing)
MCGILGAISRDDPADLSPALAALAHRGPDGGGQIQRGNVALGHRRLAIIDLTDAAAQPMTVEGCGTIVFNGEIYDHATHRASLEADGERFATRSDTEVLLRGLARHGVAFLRRLHGMYAFAWLAPDGRRVVLARDHAGMKPLYVWRGSRGVAFASEVRALAALLREMGTAVRPSAPALAGFLAWGSVPEPQCVLRDVEMLPADSALEIDVAEARVLCVHAIGRRPAVGAGGSLDAVPRAREALHHAVGRHLVADHPVALFLSSGIDSSVLAAEMARAAGPRPQAISVVLGSAGTTDEPALVRALASRLDLPLHMVPVTDWRTRLQGVMAAFDQPSIDGLNTYLVAGVAKELGYRVALSGVGADEVFGGYQHFHHRVRALPDVAPVRLLGRVAAPLSARAADPRVRRVGMLLEGAARGESLQRSWRRVYSDAQLRRLMPGVPPPPTSAPARDPLDLEQQTYLRDTLLRDTDVMGMAHGVEIRAPYLDPEVLEAAAAIGSANLLRAGKAPKWVLREGWAEDLEAGSTARKKSGFTLDVAGWLRAEGRELLAAARAGLLRRACLDPRAVASAWDAWTARLDTGHPAAWGPLFALVQLNEQFERWGEP